MMSLFLGIIVCVDVHLEGTRSVKVALKREDISKWGGVNIVFDEAYPDARTVRVIRKHMLKL